MATISTTLSLIDGVSSKLNAIQTRVDALTGSFALLDGGVGDAQSALDGFSWSNFAQGCERVGRTLESVGGAMTLHITRPLVRLGRSMYTSSVDYESAFTGVTKTVEGTDAQLEHLNQTMLELSETSPLGYIDLAGIAQTGGNLGVPIDDMETFLKQYTALQYATDQHISGEGGAQLVADYLNITEGGVGGIERFGSALVYLGNHFNATEDQILGLGKRMAAAGSLAGLSTAEILGMAAALRSVGINEEAGGSSMSKLIKQMQLAVEVGGQAQDALAGIGLPYDSGMEFVNALSVMTKADIATLAEDLNMTADAVERMGDSWLLLDQFAQASGKTSDQFAKDWSGAPAQAMSDFFAGLNAMGDQGVESILSMLDKMGITEIRESNLVAAMAAQPGLFQSAIESATAAYLQNTAMGEEYAKQLGTQESQNAMLGNELQNTMADLGDNLVTALQPALDKVNELLDAFNQLSEGDQDKIIDAFMIFAAAGPIVLAVGATVDAIGKIITGIEGVVGAAQKYGPALLDLLNSPGAWAVAGVAALGELIYKLETIPSTADIIARDLSDIKITVDEESVNQTLAAIEEVRQQAELLSGGAETEQAENNSRAVAEGWGTASMYGRALGYESAKANAGIEGIITDYTGRIAREEEKIVSATDDATRAAARAQIDALQQSMDAEVAQARADYAATISGLFNGMAAQYPEEAAKLERAAQEYDLMGMIHQSMNLKEENYIPEFMTGDARAKAQEEFNALVDNETAKIHDLASSLGFEVSDALTLSNAQNGLHAQVITSLDAEVKEIAADPKLAGLMQSIFTDSLVAENIDFTALDGALAGMFGALDFDQAMQRSLEETGGGDAFGEYLVQGLAEGTIAHAGEIAPAFPVVRDAALEALYAAFQMGSPSVLMREQGVYLPQGLALGVQDGAPAVAAAISAMAESALSAARSRLSLSEGAAIGRQLPRGLAQGILSGQGTVVAAAAQVARAAAAAARTALDIHSPSGVFAEIGAQSAAGYAEGLSRTASDAERAVGRLLSIGYADYDGAAWAAIDAFSALEHRKFLSEDGGDVALSESDMRLIRELAEREVVNHFTTAELHVDFTANNRIDSELDLDGVVAYLEDQVAQRLEMAAEGVYA